MAADPQMAFAVKQEIVGVIQGLNLTGTTTDGREVTIGPGQIKNQMVASDVSNVEYPLVLVTNEGLTEKYLDGDTATIQREIPFHVWIADKESYTSEQLDPLFQQWRGTIALAFHQQKPAGIPQCSGTRVELNPIYPENTEGYLYLVTGIVVWVEVWEAR